MQRFARILLEMQTLNTHGDLTATLRQVDDYLALAHDRAFELADLVALRQIGVKIILTVEHRAKIDLRLEPEARADGLGHAFLVDHGEHAGHGGIDQRDMAVRLAAIFSRGAGEKLGLGGYLRMNFKPDNDFPIARCALDELFGIERSRINDRVHGLVPDLRWIAVFCAASARTSRPGTALRNIGGIVISGSSRL